MPFVSLASFVLQLRLYEQPKFVYRVASIIT